MPFSIPGKEYFQKQDIPYVEQKSIFKSWNYHLFYSWKTIWKEIVWWHVFGYYDDMSSAMYDDMPSAMYDDLSSAMYDDMSSAMYDEKS